MVTTEARVPLVDLHKHHESLMPEIELAIHRVAVRADFISGEDVREFEQEFATYCGVACAVGVASGTAALELLLKAYGIGAGDEVILPANTFYATAYAVASVGAKPVLADCDASTATLDPASAEAAITPRTRAIIAVHLYGRPAEMESLKCAAQRAGILLLEDACQAHGARYRGRRVGSLADGAAFSFYPAKNLGAFGDGGMVVTDDDDVAERVRLLRDFGQPSKYQHVLLGTNARLDTIQAAVLRVKLRRLDDWNAQRETAAGRYSQLLADLPLQLPPGADAGEHVYHLYVIQSPRREWLRKELGTRRIDSGLHYPVPIHLLEAFESLGYRPGAFPNAETSALQVLSLPLFPEITLEQQKHVAGALQEALSR